MGELGERAERERRVGLLSGARFAGLEAVRREIEGRFGPTPHVDPLDGGAAARLLLLLETPGARGEAPRFVSSDNPTGTARNVRRFLREAGIGREEVVIWNAVPWVIHEIGARNRAPRRAEVAAGLSVLPSFVAALPELAVAVLAGRVAQAAGAVLDGRGLRVLAMPHPSPTIVNTSPAVGARIGAALAEARAVLASSKALCLQSKFIRPNRFGSIGFCSRRG